MATKRNNYLESVFVLFFCVAYSSSLSHELNLNVINNRITGFNQLATPYSHLEGNKFTPHQVVKRATGSDSKCNLQKTNFQSLITAPNNGFKTNYTISNDSALSLSLAWSERDDIILVTVSGLSFFDHSASNIYQSTDGGKTFLNISNKIQNANIQSSNGLQKHDIDPKKLYVVVTEGKDGIFNGNANLYVSNDSGVTFTKSDMDFPFTTALIFHPHLNYTNYLMILSKEILYVSKNNGINWTKVKTKVLNAKWGSLDVDTPSTIYCTVNVKKDEFSIASFFGLAEESRDNDLQMSPDVGKSWTVIHKHVYAFGVRGAFIYVSVFLTLTDEENDKRILEVSKNRGQTWNETQLPAVEPESVRKFTHSQLEVYMDLFYSILDMTDDLVMIHVDEVGATGYGTIYTSDATGVIYSESLQRHLFGDTTDFYAVRSMRGVYITSQIEQDQSVHTLISFDRGGEWQSIPKPSGAADCKDKKKPCNLHITGLYSLSQNVQTNVPLSVPSAKGLILVHGHVADASQISEPDVYITTDGGYVWRKALDGAHHYQIGDQGGLIVAVPFVKYPKIIKFSTDEGYCWHEYTFTDEDIHFAGLLTAPDNKEMEIAVWGYGTDNKWRVNVLDFSKVITSTCIDEDYTTWTPGDSNEGNGCFLGVKEEFTKIKSDSWCKNQRGLDLVSKAKATFCPCTKADYDCDYGYYRNDSENCILDPMFKGTVIDICERGHLEQVISLGYIKIPGDKCINAEATFHTAKHHVVDLHKVCVEGDRTALDIDLKPGYLPKDVIIEKKCARTSALIAVVVVTIVVLVAMVGYLTHRHIFSKKKNSQNPQSDSCRLVIAEELQEDDPASIPTTRVVMPPSSNSRVANHTLQQRPNNNKAQQQQPPSDSDGGRPPNDEHPLAFADNTPTVYHDDSDDDLIE